MADNIQDLLNRLQNEGQGGQSIQDLLSSINSNLSSIESTLREAARNGFSSQGNARDSQNSSRNNQNGNRGPFGQHHANFSGNRKNGKGFADRFEQTLLDTFLGSDFKKKIRKGVEGFADSLGVGVGDLSGSLGDMLGKRFANELKNSKLGQKLTGKLNDAADKLFNNDSIKDVLGKIASGEEIDISDKIAKGLKLNKLGAFGTTISKGLSKFVTGLGGVAVGLVALEVASEGARKVMKGLSEILGGLSKVANRYSASREKNLEYAQKRLVEDTETLIRAPFEILEKAANEVYEAWNANIRLIAGTQGYDKAGLQDLMSAYSARLQSEGLSSVIASTGIYSSLAKVIQSGLTGDAAVEFAYQASKYNAAIPNQDFFSFSDSYASVAANAIAAGKSQSEALQLANQSLEDFSNGLLYATRNLTGGYSTGLKDSSSLYQAAVKIAQAAKSDNISGISNALLSVSGYVGSVAPDLASNLSDLVYQLATGGNSSELVSLRSLAGINASNTEFIRQLANNPQSVLSNMFANLGKLYSQSSDAYMEKAEGYASLFGVSSEAFQRIDFMGLASAITNMNSNSNSLDQNMKLLKEGQTTTNADQLKMQQINQYLIEEGLAYVIDDQAAQLIQQHMWDEQMARELMEAKYGVDLVGDAASGLEKIVSGIEMIVNLLNPIAWLSKLGNIIKSVDEANDIQADIKQVLELGKVGQGNQSDLNNLLTRNANLNLTTSLVELLGGTSRYGNSWYNGGAGKVLSGLSHPLMTLYDGVRAISNAVKNDRGSYQTTSTTAGVLPTSKYTWGFASKSQAALASALLSSGAVTGNVSHGIVSAVTGAVSASVAAVKDKIDKMLADDYLMDQYVNQGKSYSEWVESAKNLGITDMNSALEQAGYDQASVEEYFTSKQVEQGMAEKQAQAEREKQFQEAGTEFWKETFWNEFNSPLTYLMNLALDKLDAMIALHTNWRDAQLGKLQDLVQGQIDWKDFFETSWIENAWNTEFVGSEGYFTKFFDAFVRKFIDNYYYNESGYKYSDVLDVQRKENAEKGDAVNALAEALTSNIVDLKDPTVQTNALLSQILIVVSAIMNQNNSTIGTTSLADSLAALATGLTVTTPIET